MLSSPWGPAPQLGVTELRQLAAVAGVLPPAHRSPQWMQRWLQRRPVAVVGVTRRGALLSHPAACLCPKLRSEAAGDRRYFGMQLRPTRKTCQQRWAAAADQVSAACRRHGLDLGWGWCVYAESGGPWGLEPLALISGAKVSRALLTDIVGRLNQSHIQVALPGKAWQCWAACRAADGRVDSYQTVPGSPPVVFPRSGVDERGRDHHHHHHQMMITTTTSGMEKACGQGEPGGSGA